METIESLRKQIDSAEDLQSVVKTMKGIAAVSIRQYERAVESLRGYSEVVERGFQLIAKQRPEVLRTSTQAGTGSLAAVVFGSDQGMCGSFNRDAAEHASRHSNKYGARERERVFLPVGIRAYTELENLGRQPEPPQSLPNSVEGLTPAVQRVLFTIEQWRAERGVSQVLLHYNRARRGASYRPHTVQLLPLSPDWLAELARRAWPTNHLPAHPGDWQTLFTVLVREYIFLALFRAFAESMAAENASRLAAMHAAENNIEEKIDDLLGRYHQRRQAAITEELLDVISGFEALETK